MTRKKWSRRDVLKTGAAAFALPYFVPSTVFGANERVNVGIIGLGGRARAIAESCALIPDMNVVAVCDCFKPDMDTFVEGHGKECKMVHLRRLPRDDREGEARRRDGRNDDPRPGLGRHARPCRRAWTPTSRSRCA